MRTARRILAMVLIMVIALTAIPLTASAGIADTAKSITSGQAVTTTLYTTGEQADYKINVASSGTLKISLTSEMGDCNIYVYDEYGNKIEVSNDDVSSGYYKTGVQNGDNYYAARWNSITEKYIGTINYGVRKGTYYIRFKRDSYSGNGKIKFTATYPTTAGKAAKITYLSATITKGSTLQMGTVLSPANGATVTWKSNNPKVASISSNGLITAKAKGATYISATCGSSKRWFRIIVK